MFAYVQNRIPEISDELYRIDDAMKAGFGWENGPFEIWDAIGIRKGIELMKAEGHSPAPWIEEMLNSGNTSFYSVQDGATYYYDVTAKKQLKNQDKMPLSYLITSVNPMKYGKTLMPWYKI